MECGTYDWVLMHSGQGQSYCPIHGQNLTNWVERVETTFNYDGSVKHTSTFKPAICPVFLEQKRNQTNDPTKTNRA